MLLCCPQACRPQASWTWRLIMLLLNSPPTHQKNVRELTTPSLNNYYKISHRFLQVGTQSFEGGSLLWFPLLGKVIKLSFSTSLITLSQRFNSTLAYREAELSASGTGQIEHHRPGSPGRIHTRTKMECCSNSEQTTFLFSDESRIVLPLFTQFPLFYPGPP